VAFEIQFLRDSLRSMTHPKTVWKQSKRNKSSTLKGVMLLCGATFRKRKEQSEQTFPPISISCRSNIATERLMQHVKKEYRTPIGFGERSSVSYMILDFGLLIFD